MDFKTKALATGSALGACLVFAHSALATEANDPPLATVGSRVITVRELQAEIDGFSPRVRQSLNGESLGQMLEDRIRLELLALAAEEAGTGREPAVQEAYRGALVEALLRQGATGHSDRQVSDDAIQGYYRDHQAEFNAPEHRQASWILVATRGEAEAMLDEARALDAHGFADLARRRSLDEATKQRGGDLRYFTIGGERIHSTERTVNAAVARAVFGLGSRGDLSGVIEVGGGRFAIAKLTGIVPEVRRTVVDVAASIRARLTQQNTEAQVDSLVEQARSRIRPLIRYEGLDGMQFGRTRVTPNSEAGEAEVARQRQAAGR